MVYVNYDDTLSLSDNLRTPPVMQFCGFASSRTMFEGRGYFSIAYHESLAANGNDEAKADYPCDVRAGALVNRFGLWREYKRPRRLRYAQGDDGDPTYVEST